MCVWYNTTAPNQVPREERGDAGAEGGEEESEKDERRGDTTCECVCGSVHSGGLTSPSVGLPGCFIYIFTPSLHCTTRFIYRLRFLPVDHFVVVVVSYNNNNEMVKSRITASRRLRAQVKKHQQKTRRRDGFNPRLRELNSGDAPWEPCCGKSKSVQTKKKQLSMRLCCCTHNHVF